MHETTTLTHPVISKQGFCELTRTHKYLPFPNARALPPGFSSHGFFLKLLFQTHKNLRFSIYTPQQLPSLAAPWQQTSKPYWALILVKMLQILTRQ